VAGSACKISPPLGILLMNRPDLWVRELQKKHPKKSPNSRNFGIIIFLQVHKNLRQLLPPKNTGQITRLLKRLRVHGIIKKVGRRYKYYLTEFGRQVALMALKLREMVIIPRLAHGLEAQA